MSATPDQHSPAPQAAVERYHTRVLVLGLGNDVLSDDAVGLRIARRLSTTCAGRPGVIVRESVETGLALLDEIAGCQYLIIADAIVTGQAPVGFIHELPIRAVRPPASAGPHFVGIFDTLAFGRALGLGMPAYVQVFAVEVDDPYRLGTQLSPDVSAAIEPAVERIMDAIAALAR